MNIAEHTVSILLETSEDDIMDVGVSPLQRLLRGNGWTPMVDHPRHGAEEVWKKRLRSRKDAFLLRLPYERNGEACWRYEIYRAKPSLHRYFDLPESVMLSLLRASLQRLATWNPRQKKPVGSTSGTFF